MVSLLLVALLCQDVSLERTLTLDVPFAAREPRVLVDRTGHIWVQSYWEHTLHKLDPDGRVVFKLAGPGRGPGEIEKPYCFTLVNDHRWLLLQHHDLILSIFDAQTGDFIKDLKRVYPISRLWPWDETFVLVLKDPRAVANKGFELLNYRTGEIIKRWFQLDEPRTNIVSSSMAFAQRPDHTIYYQCGTMPEVNVVTPFRDLPRFWPLKPPPGYREPPDKPLPESHRYDRVKVDEYYSSFTKVKNFANIQDKCLLVCWESPDQRPYYYQLYDLETEKLKAKALPMKGMLVRSFDGLVYTLERVDPDDMTLDPKDILRAYQIDP